MNVNYRKLFGATVIIGLILGFNIYERTLIRRQYLADRHFHVLALAVSAEARAEFAERAGGVVQDIMVSGPGYSMGGGNATYSCDWELAPKDDPAKKVDLQAFVENLRSEFQKMKVNEEKALRYYYPDLQIAVEVSVIDSKFLNKRGIKVSLNCHT
jgi:hypothetical protein